MVVRLVLAVMGTLLATGCASDEITYPGTAVVAQGAPPLIVIPPTGGTETDPAILRVPPGTEVVWQNRTRGAAFVRFDDPVADVCGEPIRFHRTTDSQSWASEYLAPFGEARLCFAHPGRYDFVVFISAGDGERRPVPRLRTSPTKYGTVVVEP